MSKRTLIAIALVVMTVSVVGAASYTSATVDRDASIAVSPDDTAVIGLDPGPVAGVSQTNGRLDIDLGQSAGLNTEASFVFGDDAAPTTTYAFSITNNDGADHQFTLSYAMSAADPSGSQNVQFEIYDSGGASAGVADEDNSASTSITAGDTYYVVITVDTTGVATTDDLSGTLTISAN